MSGPKKETPVIGAEELAAAFRRLLMGIPFREWAAGKTLAEVWSQCERGEWMWDLAEAAGVSLKSRVLAACACARTILNDVPAGEVRPLRAIDAAEAWARGSGSLVAVGDAALAAFEAADEFRGAGDAKAENAAETAACAADFENGPGILGDILFRVGNPKLCSVIVREHIPVEMVAAAVAVAGPRFGGEQ